MFTPGETFDGYRLLRRIGRGGFGEVWLCQSEAVGDYRAVKFVSSDSPELQAKEFGALVKYRNAADRLRSPFLMPVEHVNRISSGLFYVMPLADGYGADDPADNSWHPWTLEAWIGFQREQPTWFSSADVVSIIQPVLNGLQMLSDAGLVHRDVKPGNILLMGGQACLADISLVTNDSATNTGGGTPGFAAPSWYVEKGGHADMYGAAATLYTLLTGNSPDKMGRSSFRWPPQGKPSLPPAEQKEWLRMHRALMRAVEERPSNRFLTYAAFSKALTESSHSGRRKLPSVLLGASVAVLIMMVIIGVVLSQHPHGLAVTPEGSRDAVPSENVWSDFDTFLKQTQSQVTALHQRCSDLEKKADQVLLPLKSGNPTIQQLKTAITAMAPIQKAAVKITNDAAPENEFYNQAKSLEAKAVAADKSSEGWKTASLKDSELVSVYNSFGQSAAHLQLQTSEWPQYLQKTIQDQLARIQRDMDRRRSELSKQSQDPETPKKIRDLNSEETSINDQYSQLESDVPAG